MPAIGSCTHAIPGWARSTPLSSSTATGSVHTRPDGFSSSWTGCPPPRRIASTAQGASAGATATGIVVRSMTYAYPSRGVHIWRCRTPCWITLSNVLQQRAAALGLPAVAGRGVPRALRPLVDILHKRHLVDDLGTYDAAVTWLEDQQGEQGRPAHLSHQR